MPTVLLVGGHESADGRDLLPYAQACSPRAAVVAVSELGKVVSAALESTAAPVCIVPMTLGRDPGLVSETARALRRHARGVSAGRVALTRPFSTAEHLVGWLRAAADGMGRRPLTQDKDASPAVLVTAPVADPVADAELFRVARLMRQHGRHRSVEVALVGGDPDVTEGVERCRRLGAGRIVVMSAGFADPLFPRAPDVSAGAPILSAELVSMVVSARCAMALHALAEHCHDGIVVGLDAEHDHNFAYAHADFDWGPDTHPLPGFRSSAHSQL
ncbi:sirohydrochlorin chelatase [Streptomyces sp. NPDC054841]